MGRSPPTLSFLLLCFETLKDESTDRLPWRRPAFYGVHKDLAKLVYAEKLSHRPHPLPHHVPHAHVICVLDFEAPKAALFEP